MKDTALSVKISCLYNYLRNYFQEKLSGQDLDFFLNQGVALVPVILPVKYYQDMIINASISR
jgi:hypothetical protein